MRYHPHRWLMIRVGDNYKIFGSWNGGYLDSAEWRLNSGVWRVEESGKNFFVHGFSGSMYLCDKVNYGATTYGQTVLNSIMSDSSTITVLEAKEAFDILRSFKG